MIAHQLPNFISPEEYLELENKSTSKHEYRNGEVYAMAGASNNHVLIAGNLYAIIRNHIRGKGCLAFIADTKVNIESCNSYYYPDVVVSCDQRDKAFNNFICYPCLIIEVLSESTEAFDRGDKFADYRQIETLQDYILVSQTRMRVDYFQKTENHQWLLNSYQEGEEIQLLSLNLSIPVNAVYEDVSLE